MSEILPNTGAKLWDNKDDYDLLWLDIYDLIAGTGGKSDIRLIDEAIGKINENLNGYYFKIINNKLCICKDTESGTTSLPVSITDDNGHTASTVDGTTITIDENGVIHGATLDDAFSSTSENGIQNKVVTAKFNEVDGKINANESVILSHKNDQNNPHNVTKSQLNLGNVEDKSSETIRSEITKENVTTALGYTPYTPNEVDNKFSTLETNIDWKESVETYDDILVAYPNPEKGWTVNADNTTYRYNGTKWVDIGITAIPKATDNVNGLLSKEDHAKYDDTASKAHTHDNKSVLDKFAESVEGNVTYNGNEIKAKTDSELSLTSENPVQNKIITAKLNELGVDLQGHIDDSINSEEGVHGLRFYNDKLEYKTGTGWVEIETGGGGNIAIGDVIGATISSTSRQVTIKWSDPEDVIVSGATLAEWAGTLVVRKANSAPTSSTDGDIVVDSKVKNQYSSEGFTDTGLTNGTTYYYRFFPYTTRKVITDGSSVNATPQRIVITAPSQSGTLTYNGSSQSPTWNNYDSSKMTIDGTTSSTNAGTYTATFTPKEDYMWSDGTFVEKSVDWEIGKANGDITLSATSVTLNNVYLTNTVTFSGATGTVTVSSNNTSIATASVSGTTITISNVNQTVGTATITVNVASSENYNSTSKTINVTAENFVLDGETATPLNDVATWLKTDSTGASYSKGYTTLSQVIADTDTLTSLMGDKSAMKYLARSTGFADEGCANETFMTYLGASSYVDETVLNSYLWKQAIKESQYWALVYASKTVTVYGGAYETITIDGYGGSFTTNADGSVSHVVPIDTITLTGSVSGQSFTRTVTSDTTEVKVMPEGALYWYGNECTWITGGWGVTATGPQDTGGATISAPSVDKNTNNMYAAFSNNLLTGSLNTNYKITISPKQKISIYGDFNAKILYAWVGNYAFPNINVKNTTFVAFNEDGVGQLIVRNYSGCRSTYSGRIEAQSSNSDSVSYYYGLILMNKSDALIKEIVLG